MFKITHQRPPLLLDTQTKYCPACGHGIATRILFSALERLKSEAPVREFLHWPIGCAVLGYKYGIPPSLLASHGTCPFEAMGAKLCFEILDPITAWLNIFYGGDGDLYAIGNGHLMSAAKSGINVTGICINNFNYAMTGGQMSPTTLPQQVTLTTPEGRNPREDGEPIDMIKRLVNEPGVAYLARGALLVLPDLKKLEKLGIKNQGSFIHNAEEFIYRALRVQLERRGFSFVELISPCPIGLKMSPQECDNWIVDNVLPRFPIGEFKTPYVTITEKNDG